MMGPTSGLLGNGPASTVYNGIGGTTNITNAGTIGTTGILGFTAGRPRRWSPRRGRAGQFHQRERRRDQRLRGAGPERTGRHWQYVHQRGNRHGERVARRGRRDVEYVQCADRIVGRPRCRCGPRRQQHAQPAVEHGRRQRRTAPSRSIRSAISPISRWGGTWNINGASTASNASLTGGTAILNNSGGLGTGAIVVGGGTLEPARPG